MIDPTPEQIEAAAIAFTCETRDEWDRSPETYKQMIREDARDALIAAAAAGAAAGAYDHCCQHEKCPGSSLCCCASEQRLRQCWNQWQAEGGGDVLLAFRNGYGAGRNDLLGNTGERCGHLWSLAPSPHYDLKGLFTCALPPGHGGPHVDAAEGVRWHGHPGTVGEFSSQETAPARPRLDEETLVEVIDRAERSTRTGSKPHRHRVIARAITNHLRQGTP